MKSVYKKVSVIALSSMIIAGGIASSGINAKAYSPELSRQIQDIGKGASVYYEAKQIANMSGAVVEAVFAANADMNRYVQDNYWDKIQGQSESAKKAKKDLLGYVECGNNPQKLESKIKDRAPGDLFRVRYQRYFLLIRVVKYKKLSDIPEMSPSDIEKNLSYYNRKLYNDHIKDVVKKAGYKVILMGDKSRQNDKKMNDYIKARFKEGVFNGNNSIEEELLVGIGCIDFDSIRFNLEYHGAKDVMRLSHQGVDMLLVRK